MHPIAQLNSKIFNARNGEEEKEIYQTKGSLPFSLSGREVAVYARNGDDEKEIQQASCSATCS